MSSSMVATTEEIAMFQVTCNIRDVEVSFQAQVSILTEDDLKERVAFLGEQINSNPRAIELCQQVYASGDVRIQFADLQKKSRARWLPDYRMIVIDPSYEKTTNLRSLVFEWCNAENAELNRLNYADYEDSFEYAEELEKAEWNTIIKAHEIVTGGMRNYNWPLKDVALPKLEDQKLRSTVYSGYSHYLLNVKFHNDARIYWLQKKTLDDRENQELRKRKLLALTMEWEAKKYFPTKVIIAALQEKNVNQRAIDKYTAELKAADDWFHQEEKKLRLTKFQSNTTFSKQE